MKDIATKQPLHVWADSTVGPYMMVPVVQLEDVRRLLDQHGIDYSVDELAISLNDAPEVVFVSLGREGDAKFAQKILDDVD